MRRAGARARAHARAGCAYQHLAAAVEVQGAEVGDAAVLELGKQVRDLLRRLVGKRRAHGALELVVEDYARHSAVREIQIQTRPRTRIVRERRASTPTPPNLAQARTCSEHFFRTATQRRGGAETTNALTSEDMTGVFRVVGFRGFGTITTMG